MKKFKSFLSLTLITFMFSVVQATASDEIKVILNGKQLSFTQPPVIVNNRTLVPMRAIFEALGAEVTWNADTKTATGTKKGIKVELTISDSTMTRNYVPVPIDVPAKIINNSTMIPLRVVSECFGMDVKWDADTRVITIAETNPVGRLPWNDYYYYYGEIVDGQGIGYGELYSIETDEVLYSGYFNGTSLTEGMKTLSNGDITIGAYNSDGLLTGIGCYILEDGYYVGNFVNGIYSGSGERYWANGDRYDGNWNDGKMNGQGTYYWDNGDYFIGNFVENMRSGLGTYYQTAAQLSYEGNYINDNMDDIFIVRNISNNNISHYAYYSNGNYINHANSLKELQSKIRIPQIYARLSELLDEETAARNEYSASLTEANQWRSKKQNELLALIDCDPYETDWAKQIYKQYGISSTSSQKNNNIDSFSAANAARQQLSIINTANTAILNLHQTKIDNLKDIIESGYNQRITSAESLYNSTMIGIETERQQLQAELDSLK